MWLRYSSLIALLFSSLCYAGSEIIGPFGSLSNTESSYVIPANQAQDLLNVDLSDSGKSIKKRSGYGLAFNLSNSTSPAHGVYNFYDSNGADISLIFNDRNMNVSVSAQSPSVFFSTGTNGATYQCTDSAGFAYCANTSRDAIIKVNSSTYTLLTGFTSTGTMVAVTTTRLVQAGFSGSPNMIWFSKANDFTTWTTGGNPVDPIQFTVTSPGSSIKHIVFAHGRLYWFKDSSFGYILEGQTQADWRLVTISSFLGSLYNTSIYRDEVLYFQGNDGHFYAYDGSNLVQLSKDIQTTINQTQSRTSNAWTQSTQSEFTNGTSSADISITQIPNSVIAKTSYYMITSSIQFSSGTFVGTSSQSANGFVTYIDTFTYPGTMRTMWPDPFNVYRSSGNNKVWVGEASGCVYTIASGTMIISGTSGGNFCGMNAQYGSNYLANGVTFYWVIPSSVSATSAGGPYIGISTSARGTEYPKMIDWGGFNLRLANCTVNSAGVQGLRVSLFDDQVGETFTAPTCMPLPAEISLYLTNTAWQLQVGTTATTGVHTMPNRPYYAYTSVRPVDSTTQLHISNFGIHPQTFTWTSGSYDTGIVIPKWSTYTIVSGGLPTIVSSVTVSSDDSTYDNGVAITSTSFAPNPKRYAKIHQFFNVNSATDTPATIYDFTIQAGSSGTFLSAVNNAPNLTTWDVFNANTAENDGFINFYTRARSGVFTVLDSTPAWVLTPKGSIPTTSTGTYIQARADFVARSTGPVRMDDFTFNWFEGAASDKTYAIYHDNSNWWSVTSGTGATTNNKILKFNLINPGWYIYDIGTGGMLVRNQSMYFGSVSAGKFYKYGDTNDDDGAAINSYWKSKDFSGTDPFVDRDYTRLSAAFSQVANSTVTITYTLNGSSMTSYSVNLGSSTHSFIQKNVNLPLGSTGRSINVKFGNNGASQPWELFGGKVDYNDKSWVPK